MLVQPKYKAPKKKDKVEQAKAQAKHEQRLKDIERLTDLLTGSKGQTEAYKWGVLDSIYQLREQGTNAEE
jgi:hypothetical protein